MKSGSGAAGRIGVLAASAVCAIPYVMWFAGRLVPPHAADSPSHFGMVALVFRPAEKMAERADLLLSWFFHLASFVGLVTCAFSILLVVRSHRVAAARLLATSLASMNASFAYFYYLRVFPEYGLASSGPAAIVADLVASTLAAIGIYRMVGFFVSYPARVDGAAIIAERHRKGINLDRFPGMVGRAATFITRHLSVERFEFERGLLWWLIGIGALATALAHLLADFRFDAVFPLGVVLPAALLGGCIGLGFGVCSSAIKYNHRHSLPDARRQIEWIYFGFSIMTLSFIAIITIGALIAILLPREAGRVFLYPVPLYLPTILFLVFLLSIILSIFYRGSVDPALAIRKTSVYSLLGVFLGALFVLIERALAGQIARFIGLPDGAGFVVAGVVAGAAFSPARRWLDEKASHFISRLMPATYLAEGVRKEAAIAFSDLSGFTALTATDERLALTLAGLFHKQARVVAGEFGGRVVKTIGDAVLCQFPDGRSSVLAVDQLHRRFAMASEKLGLPRMGVHSGIHFGDIVQALDGDVYGATVNLAARLQGEAGDNEVIATNAVRAAVPDMAPSFRSLGARRFRNVPEAIDCYLMVTA